MDMLIFIVALLILMFLIYRGKNIIFVVPIILVSIILLTRQTASLPDYSITYFLGMIDFIITNALLFFLGVLFGAVISATKIAEQMAQYLINKLGHKYVILALVLLTNAMMLGGISGFIIIFTMFPIANHVFTTMNIPKRFIFGLIAVAMATYMIGTFPGSLQVQNILPIAFLDSSIFSGWQIGIPLTVYLFITGYSYLIWRIKKAVQDNHQPVIAVSKIKMSGLKLFAPLITVFLANLVFSLWIMPLFDLSNHQRTLYSINSALALGIVLTLLFSKTKVDIVNVLYRSALMALKPLLFVGTTVGFGLVISQMPFLEVTKASLLSLHPLYSLPLSVAMFAAISGSATGGLAIAFPFLGEPFLERVALESVSHDSLHRLALMSSVTIDTLPTNGTTLTMLKVTGLNYKDIYLDYFIITVLNTTIALGIGIFLVMIFSIL